MTEFHTPTDIGNRALQHCGATLLNAALGFTENSERARAISFAYGKLRRAEIGRNDWRFAIKLAPLRAIDATTMLLTPSLWVAGTTYFVGSIVADETGNLWISNAPDNLGNQPENTLAWEPYFGPLTVSLYDSGTSYMAGELVYTAAGDGTNRVFLSLVGGNADDPATATAWSATATYAKNQVVTYLSVAYMSAVDLNTGNTPVTILPWSAGTTYSIGNQVVGSDGIRYTSLTNGNVGHDPVIDGGVNWQNDGVVAPWTTTFVGGAGSLKWRQIGGAEFPNGVALRTIDLTYPLGAGPSSQSSSRNVFRLPNGYLRKAPQDPKAGSNSWLGAPTGRPYDDWDLQDDYLVSGLDSVIVLRFVADVTDVRRMNDMFCEGLAARIAEAVCEPLTQSTAKLNNIRLAYRTVMKEARIVNAIETGSVEPPLDDYIACRA